jgi:polysaccharide export outer membrane protein
MLAACGADPTMFGSRRLPASSYNAVSAQSDYRLAVNDKVRIKVYGETDISGEYDVGAGGNVSIPLAGSVKAAGRSTRELERAIAAALSKGMLRDPRVTVEVAQHSPFYILGEVKRAGEYPYKPGMTVLDAVASAGGFTYRANEGKAYLRRAGAAADELVALDSPIAISPGDNIRIPERYF